jgi:hypothetical protein
LKGDRGVVGEDDAVFPYGHSQEVFQGREGFIYLHEPTALSASRDGHPFSFEDAVLAVEGQMVRELAYDDLGKKPHVCLTPGYGVIGHGGGDDTRFDVRVRCCVFTVKIPALEKA